MIDARCPKYALYTKCTNFKLMETKPGHLQDSLMNDPDNGRPHELAGSSGGGLDGGGGAGPVSSMPLGSPLDSKYFAKH